MAESRKTNDKQKDYASHQEASTSKCAEFSDDCAIAGNRKKSIYSRNRPDSAFHQEPSTSKSAEFSDDCAVAGNRKKSIYSRNRPESASYQKLSTSKSAEFSGNRKRSRNSMNGTDSASYQEPSTSKSDEFSGNRKKSRNSSNETASGPFLSLSASALLMSKLCQHYPVMKKSFKQFDNFFDEMMITAWGKAIGNPKAAVTLNDLSHKMNTTRDLWQNSVKEGKDLTKKIEGLRSKLASEKKSHPAVFDSKAFIEEELRKFREQCERGEGMDEISSEEDDELRELENKCSALKKELEAAKSDNLLLKQTLDKSFAADIKKWEEETEAEIQEIQTKDFCAVCDEPSTIDCCFKNTYCSTRCQQLHYNSHKEKCTRSIDVDCVFRDFLAMDIPARMCEQFMPVPSSQNLVSADAHGSQSYVDYIMISDDDDDDDDDD